MGTQPDLRLYGRDGHLVLVGDVRTNRGTSPEWAAMLRRNLMELDEFPAVTFFLIATPDRIYIWRDAPKGSALIPPSYVIDAQSLLKPYFEGAKVNAGEITDPAFEMMIAIWLSDLVRLRDLPGDLGNRQGWLKDSSFHEVIKNGRVELAAAA